MMERCLVCNRLRAIEYVHGELGVCTWCVRDLYRQIHMGLEPSSTEQAVPTVIGYLKKTYSL